MTDLDRRNDELPHDDERPADPDVEGLLGEAEASDVPDDDRLVPEDVNEFVRDEYESEV